MLELSLNTKFTPGTNLKGDVTGANWAYLLPSLALGRVIIVGIPLASTLRALVNLAEHIVISVTSTNEQQRVMKLIDELPTSSGVPVIASIIASNGNPGVDEAGSIDLIILADRRSTRRLLRDDAFVKECRRLLTPTGSIYFENYGSHPFGSGSAVRKSFESKFGPLARLWLTPVAGEMHTAVPLDDSAMINELFARRLECAYVTVQKLRPPRRGAKNDNGNGAPPNEQAGSLSNANKRLSPAMKAASATKEFVRNIGHLVVSTSRGLERKFQRSEFARRRYGRVGNLLGGDAASLLDGPPRYLRDMARQSGIAIDDCRWAYSASGEYSSRKLLFLLFNRSSQLDTRPKPAGIVKMTRAVEFNARLERERDALRKLEQLGLGSDGSLPRVLFAGTAGKLAVVGESFVDGVPFDARSRFTAECPLIHSAMEWLTKLGELTADHQAACPEKIAEGLRFLFTRFVEIFPVTAEEHRFLEDQIETLAQSASPIPLVFQHGDPGRWNVFATHDDRAIFLDWESAEYGGIPLWDLFYLIRSFSVGVGTVKSQNLDVNEAFSRQAIRDTALSRINAKFVADYVRRVGIPGEAIEPLFYTCWMHRALKEATRLAPGSVHLARYFQLLRLCMAMRDSPGLQQLFSVESRTPVLPAVTAMKS